jgi:hypothetical protein
MGPSMDNIAFRLRASSEPRPPVARVAAIGKNVRYNAGRKMARAAPRILGARDEA